MRPEKASDHRDLLRELREAYREYAPVSADLNRRAEAVLVDGGSHALRLMDPFPPRIASARGAWVYDEDGHQVLDFWQGHCGNILGHNPDAVAGRLAAAFSQGQGLQVGLTDRLQVEVAELICRTTATERVGLTTSGTLATMYATMLARAFAGRDLIIKIGGGWHGGQPWGLKGVGFRLDGSGFDHADSGGLSQGVIDNVLLTRYNDPDMLENQFREFGDEVAGMIVEPFIGGGGSIPATQEYLTTARRLTERCGAVLILDEVISGYHFRAGDLGALYGIQADLITLGKMVGGGMPVAAVAGRADIMSLAVRAGTVGGNEVRFSGGTYSGHPASLMAAKAALEYLIDHENEVYPRIFALGQSLRRRVESAFAGEGIYAWCSGGATEYDALPGSPLFRIHFPYAVGRQLVCPDEVFDPAICDVALRTSVVPLALLLENVHVMQGHGMVTAAHSEEHLDVLEDACRRVAHRISVSEERQAD
ncbi:MAG: aminotransferase class III-fold pyridoxal phosphate-dependent enzyme [Chloroflexi bacterium]|nr:aminotransferase class III-fold pyridoxal phosphate-dependent enzyme [Chloroflexota bacterium]